MKKLLMFAALTVAPIAFAVPAHAQYCDQICRDEARDPAYQHAIRSGRYYGGYNNYVAPVPCFLFTCLLNGNSHKPKDGELRTLPDGTTVSYQKSANRWVVVNRPATQPRGVYTDRDVYMAQ